MKKNVFVRFITVTHTIMSLCPCDWLFGIGYWNAYLMCHGRGFENLLWSQIFPRCIQADLELIMNAEYFAQIDRIDRIFDYERNQCC